MDMLHRVEREIRRQFEATASPGYGMQRCIAGAGEYRLRRPALPATATKVPMRRAPIRLHLVLRFDGAQQGRLAAAPASGSEAEARSGRAAR